MTYLFFYDHDCSEICERDGCRNRSEPGRPHRIKQAKALCASCPVQDECLMWAMQVQLPYGIAGGLTERERKTLKRRIKNGAR